MGLAEIMNLIIASVPAITAIVTVLILAFKLISAFVDLKNNVSKSNADNKQIIEEIKISNQNLQDQSVVAQQEISDLTNQVKNLLAKVDSSNDNQTNQEV